MGACHVGMCLSDGTRQLWTCDDSLTSRAQFRFRFGGRFLFGHQPLELIWRALSWRETNDIFKFSWLSKIQNIKSTMKENILWLLPSKLTSNEKI